MSTRSSINIQNEDGSVDGIYCHYDGHVDSVGKMLINNYTTDEKVRELIDLGDISYLGPTPSEEDTRSYHRWRDEDLNISHYSSADEIDRRSFSYNYLWKNDMWWLSESGSGWIPLDQVIMEAKADKFYPAINEELPSGFGLPKYSDNTPSYAAKAATKLYGHLLPDGYVFKVGKTPGGRTRLQIKNGTKLAYEFTSRMNRGIAESVPLTEDRVKSALEYIKKYFLNEVYGGNLEWDFIKADDTVPTRQKKAFRDVVRDIERTLLRDSFNELQIEDYLKRLVEEIIVG